MSAIHFIVSLYRPEHVFLFAIPSVAMQSVLDFYYCLPTKQFIFQSFQFYIQCLIAVVALSKDVYSQIVPEPTVFNDQSALTVKSNLQSQAYQDFIHQLYRYDKDSLKRVDNLFENPAQSGKSTINGYANQQQQQQQLQAELQERLQQPSYSTYISSLAPSNNRYKRDAHGAIFRPRFVYRIYQDVKQDRLREREEERIQKRLYNSNYYKRLSSPNYSRNEY